LADEKFVKFGKSLPIQVSQVVAGEIRSVLGEFNGEAAKGALVPTRQRPFNRPASRQFNSPQL